MLLTKDTSCVTCKNVHLHHEFHISHAQTYFAPFKLYCFKKYVDVILSDIIGYRYKNWRIYQFLIHIQIQIFYWLTKKDSLNQQYKQN